MLQGNKEGNKKETTLEGNNFHQTSTLETRDNKGNVTARTRIRTTTTQPMEPRNTLQFLLTTVWNKNTTEQ